MVIVKLAGVWQTEPMKIQTSSYREYRFPSEIISHSLWLYHRFCLTFSDFEELLAERGIIVVTSESIQPMMHIHVVKKQHKEDNVPNAG